MRTLHIHVLTIFPDIFGSFLRFGMVKRAIEKKALAVTTGNIRDAATDRHRTVDDTPYGGGAGMVMKPDILARALENSRRSMEKEAPCIYLTPQGKRFDQDTANRLSVSDEFILLCGRYREIDERFRAHHVDEEVSIGDYVLSGGEPAAMVVIDAVARLIPGVLHDFESGLQDSFQDNRLDCPWYTRPEIFEGERVPEVLLSGDHARILEWREKQKKERTKARRPDLLQAKEKE